MKRLNKVLLTASLVLVSLPACAGHKGPGYVKARVVSAIPVYETVRFPVDEQVCWQEQAWREPHHSVAPVVLGAVIGGVVGNQFGGGHGRTASTVAGMAIGGAVGHGVSNHNKPYRRHPYTINRCEIQRHWRTEQRISAWDVMYRYHGRIYHTRTLQEPNRKIRVGVYAQRPWQ